MTIDTVSIRLEPWSTAINVPAGSPLLSTLAANGVEFPCGGFGICGGCRVRVLAGTLPVTPEDQSFFSISELSAGWRLACQARVESSLILECSQARMDVLSDSVALPTGGRSGHGIAIDLGTTTIAAQLVDLSTGNILAVRTALNQQVQFGSDIMSRIGAALSGADLTSLIRAQLGVIVAELAATHTVRIRDVILVGNTVMHHLFCRLSIEPLSHAPFQSPHVGQQCFSPAELDWPLPADCTIRFAPCIGGFVGSDILAGILAAGIAKCEQLTALVDLGTNGEIAIGNRHGIVCASTAAGPAFEAGTIRMGMRAAPGAIAHVALTLNGLQITTIGECEPRGICGSGLVDAIAASLASGAVLPSGRIVNASRTLPIAGTVSLYQSDVRELQLAKAAIASGVSLLLDHLNASPADLSALHLAGAFGNYLHVRNALAIGLFACAEERIHPAGNTALRGARMMLLAGDVSAPPPIRYIALAALPDFQERFENNIGFPTAVLAS